MPKSLQFSEPNVQNDAHIITEGNASNPDPLDCEGPPTSHDSDTSVEQQGVFFYPIS